MSWSFWSISLVCLGGVAILYLLVRRPKKPDLFIYALGIGIHAIMEFNIIQFGRGKKLEGIFEIFPISPGSEAMEHPIASTIIWLVMNTPCLAICVGCFIYDIFDKKKRGIVQILRVYLKR